MPNNRVRLSRAPLVLKELERMGVSAKLPSPSTSLHGGSTRPSCCDQHSGFAPDGEQMVSVLGPSARQLSEAVRAVCSGSEPTP